MEVLETPVASNQHRTELLNILGGFSQHLADEVNIGTALIELEMSNTFTNLIDAAIQDPLSATVNAIAEMEKYVIGITDRSIRDFLKTKKNYITKAYKTYGGSTLHYCIVLKKDTSATRGKFYDFLDIYAQNIALSRRFPVVFKFIPVEYVAHLLEQAEPII